MNNSVLCYLENTVKRFPDRIAVFNESGEITFDQLRCFALSLAERICQRGIEKKPVFVYLPKSGIEVACFMGVLYSHNFYTPTDVDFPFAKAESIIKALDPALILSTGEYMKKLVDGGVDEGLILDIATIVPNDKAEQNAEEYISRIIDTDLAYVLFTSGSTGVPKGVAVTQRGVLDYIDWAVETFGIDELHRIGSQAPFYFDNSTLDIYLMLRTGATLDIIPVKLFAFPAKLIEYVVENGINTVFWVPSVLINVANYDILTSIQATCLKTILFAGEIMPNKQLNYWRERIPDAIYANLYGPTEITVDCTYYVVDREFSDDEPLPIGVPCRNSDVLVLDENDHLIQTDDRDTIGELCVRGSSLAVGYWKNPEKTAEVFVQNPLNPYYDEKIYRTGDLVYYNENGELVFSGRKDSQIKHLGYRIELGEIEAAILGCEGITGGCVVYDHEQKRIVLFYTGNAERMEIRRYLTNILPKYMVPTVYIMLEKFPYNDNGKIDRKKLASELN